MHLVPGSKCNQRIKNEITRQSKIKYRMNRRSSDQDRKSAVESYLAMIMYGLLAESHICNYNMRTYRVAEGGSYDTIPPVKSVFNTITRQARDFLS